MNAIILTSHLDMYDEDEFKNKYPRQISNDNNIVDIFKEHIKKYDNFLMIASDPDNHLLTSFYCRPTFKAFDLTLSFKNYNLLDGRNITDAPELIKQADFILLSGGHVPTQAKFFEDIKLKELIKNTDAVICGISAGSMNCADIVYAPAEHEGESIDPNYKIFLKGLGLTNINLLPHYDTYGDLILDGKKYIEEIIIPDSFKTKIIAIPDGSYVTIINNNTELHGEGFIIENGITTEVINKNLNFLEK